MSSPAELWRRLIPGGDVPHEQIPLLKVSDDLVAKMHALPESPEKEIFTQALGEIYGYAHANAERINKMRATVQRMYRTNMWGLLIIVVILVAVGVATIKVTIDQSNEHHRETVAQLDQQKAQQKAQLDQQKREAAQKAAAVQESRYQGTLASCRRSNRRHDRAVAYVHTILVAQLGPHPTPVAKAAGEKGQMEFDTLINDLTPVHADCRAYATKQTALPVH